MPWNHQYGRIMDHGGSFKIGHIRNGQGTFDKMYIRNGREFWRNNNVTQVLLELLIKNFMLHLIVDCDV